MSVSVRPRELEIVCPSCGLRSFLDESTPHSVIDWEALRFACPGCWGVLHMAVTVTPIDPPRKWRRAAQPRT
jgi:hypothetical protein